MIVNNSKIVVNNYIPTVWHIFPQLQVWMRSIYMPSSGQCHKRAQLFYSIYKLKYNLNEYLTLPNDKDYSVLVI